jgi:hypothetical protein
VEDIEQEDDEDLMCVADPIEDQVVDDQQSDDIDFVLAVDEVDVDQVDFVPLADPTDIQLTAVITAARQTITLNTYFANAFAIDW